MFSIARGSTARIARVALWAVLIAGTACFPQTIGNYPAPRTIPLGPPGWNLDTREHLDLWLHGYAMLREDQSTLPFFLPGYRDRLAAVRQEAGVFSLLDANADRLVPHLTSNPALVNGQFAPMYFRSWAELRDGIDALLRVNGVVSRANSSERSGVATLQRMFPTAADREWLRTFARSLDDERTQFFDSYWQDQQRSSRDAFAAADAALRAATTGPLSRYIVNANVQRGTVLMSLPLGGEGRTVLHGVERPLVAVPRPLTEGSANSVVYVFVHELVSEAVSVASREFTGALPQNLSAEAYETSSLVRAGHHLLQLAAPDLATGYAAWYVRLTGREPGRDPDASLTAIFPLPSNLEAAVFAQVREVWDGA